MPPITSSGLASVLLVLPPSRIPELAAVTGSMTEFLRSLSFFTIGRSWVFGRALELLSLISQIKYLPLCYRCAVFQAFLPGFIV